MPKLKRITYYLPIMLLISCGITKNFEKELGEKMGKGFGILISNSYVLAILVDESISSIYKENLLEGSTSAHIYSFNASFVGKRFSPFDVTLKDIDITENGITLSNPLKADSILTAVYRDGRTYPFHLLYLSSDTLAINVTCSYSHESRNDSISYLTASYILNGAICDSGNLLRLNPDGSCDTLPSVSKSYRSDDSNDFSVEYRLTKKGKWEKKILPDSIKVN